MALVGFFQSRVSLEAEILALRVRRKSPKQLTYTSMDRLVFASHIYGVSDRGLTMTLSEGLDGSPKLPTQLV